MYPDINVYLVASLSYYQLALPGNFTRETNKIYEEVDIPATEQAPANVGQDRVPIDSLDEVRHYYIIYLHTKIFLHVSVICCTVMTFLKVYGVLCVMRFDAIFCPVGQIGQTLQTAPVVA